MLVCLYAVKVGLSIRVSVYVGMDLHVFIYLHLTSLPACRDTPRAETHPLFRHLKYLPRGYLKLRFEYYRSLDVCPWKFSLQREKYASVNHTNDRSVHSLQTRFTFAPLLHRSHLHIFRDRRI